MKWTVLLLFVLLAAAAPTETAAQSLTPDSPTRLVLPPILQTHSVPVPRFRVEEDGPDPVVASGLFLGVIGMLGGAASAGLRGSGCDKPCRTRTGAVGATVGAAFMVPVGAHIGNRERGNLLLSMLTASAIGAAGFGAANLLPGRPVAAAVFLTAPLQVVIAAKIEHWTEPEPPITTK